MFQNRKGNNFFSKNLKIRTKKVCMKLHSLKRIILKNLPVKMLKEEERDTNNPKKQMKYLSMLKLNNLNDPFSKATKLQSGNLLSQQLKIIIPRRGNKIQNFKRQPKQPQLLLKTYKKLTFFIILVNYVSMTEEELIKRHGKHHQASSK